jgi:hypothetical protein
VGHSASRSLVDAVRSPRFFPVSSIQTTHGYIEADMAIKERALQKLAPASKAITRFKADDALLTFLASL